MKKRTIIRGLAGGGSAVFALLLAAMVPSTASAQDVDADWLPWLGCWEGLEAGQEAPMLCIRPAANADGVEMLTWSEGKIVSSETIRTDGIPRQAVRDDCQGVEEARFSDDARRVYLKSQYTCQGGTERTTTGLIAMINPAEWVDIKVVDTGGQEVPWSMKYRRANATRVAEAGMEDIVASRRSAVLEARIVASAPLTAEDLIEASGQVGSEAVEALVAERGDEFDVNADMLLKLADAGVSPKVIDLVVAVSYPERFAVTAGAVTEEQARPYAGTAMPPYYGGRWGYYPYYDPFMFGYGYPFGFGGLGYYGGGYYRPTTIVVQPRSPSSSGGRIVRGRGYTRPGSGSSSGSGTVTRGSPAGGMVTSSGGARSGGSSSSTGRVAKPRGSGGGGGSK